MLASVVQVSPSVNLGEAQALQAAVSDAIKVQGSVLRRPERDHDSDRIAG